MKTNKFPRVSVLIPAFNEEKYIRSALQCIVEQNYPDFEVIVINNASTDQTSKVVENFIKKQNNGIQIKLIYEGRKGTQFAREAGRKVANGSILAQLDADCIPSKNWLKKGVEILSDDRIVAVTGPYDYFDSPVSIRLFTMISQIALLKPMNSLIQIAKRGAILIGGNTLIKASTLENSGGYNTDFNFYGDDTDIALRASQFGKVIFSNRLIMKTSSRRYASMGFYNVQNKYNRFFFRSVFNQPAPINESIELVHPR